MGEHFIRMGAMWWVFRVLFWLCAALLLWSAYRTLYFPKSPQAAWLEGVTVPFQVAWAVQYFKIEVGRNVRSRAAFKALRDVEAQS